VRFTTSTVYNLFHTQAEIFAIHRVCIWRRLGLCSFCAVVVTKSKTIWSHYLSEQLLTPKPSMPPAKQLYSFVLYNCFVLSLKIYNVRACTMTSKLQTSMQISSMSKCKCEVHCRTGANKLLCSSYTTTTTLGFKYDDE